MEFLQKITGCVVGACLCAVAAHAAAPESLPFIELSGKQDKPVTLAAFHGHPALLLFWRSDCAPCLKELAALPEIAREYPDLQVALVSLQDEAHTRQHLPAQARVLVAPGDGVDALHAFGGSALPFSLMLRADGSVCDKHDGILGTDKIKEWVKLC